MSLYIHIPFCKSRCIYCDFYSTTGMTVQDRYINAVLKELSMRYNEPFTLPETIYLGGGTPSSLSTEQLQRLTEGVMKTVDTERVKEWTIECNPDDLTPQFCDWLSSSPFNRVSIGIQTFDDTRLKWLHRRHTAQQAKKAVDRLHDAGISNVSIDLMFGFPTQTLKEWENDISQAVELHPEHISAYSLMYEEGTVLYQKLTKGEIEEIDDELSLNMYTTLLEHLGSSGYDHYEISNFCLPGYESRHNSGYWSDVPYLGLGASAHSYDRKRRWWNIDSVNKYIDAIESGVLSCEYEEIDPKTHYNDLITTALRTKRGLDISSLAEPFRGYIEEMAKNHLASGHMQMDGTYLSLTKSGLFISDNIMSDLIYE